MENKRNQLKPGDTIMCIKSFWNAETQTQVKEGYIVKNMAQFDIDCLSHPECWEKVNSTREQALLWWDSLSVWGNPSKEYYMGLYYSDDNVTPERIEEIWKNEVQIVSKDVRPPKVVREGLVKPNQKQLPKELEGVIPRITTIEEKVEAVKEWNKKNQKQFKQFDESLFKAYIDKFSDEDKAKALEIIFKSLPNSLACNFILENS